MGLQPSAVRIAAGDVGEVSLCPDNGAIVLHLKCLSLRFDRSSFERLGVLLGQAQARLDHHKRVAALFCESEAELAEPAPACAAC